MISGRCGKCRCPKDYVANTITDAGALSQAGYKSEKTETLLNMPVVPDKSIARERLNGESPELQRACIEAKSRSFSASMKHR